MSRLRLMIFVAALTGCAVAGAFFLYGKKGDGGNHVPEPCAVAAAEAEALKPLAIGEIAALQPSSRPVSFPAVQFESPQGVVGSGSFSGRVVLLNLWATWCVPCREEMPALDLLQQKLGSDAFEVVAVNMDTRNLDRVPKWLDDNKIHALTRYMDPAGKVFQTLRMQGKVQGLPTTFVVNGRGCVLAEMAGPANWASDEALALLRAAIKSR